MCWLHNLFVIIYILQVNIGASKNNLFTQRWAKSVYQDVTVNRMHHKLFASVIINCKCEIYPRLEEKSKTNSRSASVQNGFLNSMPYLFLLRNHITHTETSQNFILRFYTSPTHSIFAQNGKTVGSQPKLSWKKLSFRQPIRFEYKVTQNHPQAHG